MTKKSKKSKSATSIKQNLCFEYICLECNQLYTSKDILKHLQQYKDHIDCCILIDDIKNQLSTFDNNSNNNCSSGLNSNNIFKKRIDTIWSELERLSKSYSDLNTKSKEISDHFEQLHNRLMIKEHSLKKQIKEDINLISCDIIHQINELKSITNIINQNNNNHNNNNKSYINNDLSDYEDTQDKYTITTIIESIKQSKSYNQFISNNKNTLFYNNNNNNMKNDSDSNNEELFTILNILNNYNKEFKLCLSNPNKVNTESFKLKIDKDKYIIKIDNKINKKLYKLIDSSIIVDISPSVLVRIDDFEGLKQYYNRNTRFIFNKSGNPDSNIYNQQFTETIIEILKSNRIDILKYLIKDLNFSIDSILRCVERIHNVGGIASFSLLNLATVYSNLETIKYIVSYGIKNNFNLDYIKSLELSPLSNNIDILQYFSSKVLGNTKSINGITLKDRIQVVENAVLIGRIDMLEWITQNTPFEIEQMTIYIAASSGQLETLKWLINNRTKGCTEQTMDGAAKYGHLEIVKWLHENRTEGCTLRAIDYAAENGHLEIIKWLHENRTEGCTSDAMDEAAINGHIEIIKWLHENRTEGCSSIAMDHISLKCDLEAIKWLHENRTEGCTTIAMDYAAENGHLEIVKWLHENRTEGCTTDAMNKAAEKGNLEIIKWLHENRTEGCTYGAMDMAAKNDNLETVIWLYENKPEDCWIENAIGQANGDSLDWLNELIEESSSYY